MFPDTKALTASVQANTEVQEALLGILKDLTKTVASLTTEVKELRLRLKAENQRSGTNSSGPK